MKEFLEAGKIVGTHGVHGDVKVQPWCDSAEVLSSLQTLYFCSGEKEVKVEKSKVHKGNVLMKLEGIDTVEKAMGLCGKILYLNRKDIKLDKDTFFIQDIIGCSVIDLNTNELYGLVTDVFKTGANDVYQISNDGKNFLIPVIPDVVDSIDVESKKIFITPLENLFD